MEAPGGVRIEKVVREAMESAIGAAASAAIAAKVRLLGLEPYQPPVPLPPIDLDEITLICWMAVSASSG